MASSTCSPPRIPVSQSWMTAVRGIALLFLFLRAVVADVIVAEVVVRRHLAEALDAYVLSGALFERVAGAVVVHGGVCSTRRRVGKIVRASLSISGEHEWQRKSLRRRRPPR